MAVNLSPVAGAAAQFLDNSGNVLTGGKLYTYAAGTTTPQATYTSSAGVTFHSNPIILDAAGRVPAGGEIWLSDNVQYKFVLKDSNDVLIGTWDNLIGINSNFLNFYTQEEIQTATAGQTVFTLTTVSYTPGTNSLSVFVDGVNQYDGSSYAYVETDSTTVTFTAGLHVGALVKFTTAVTLSAGVTSANLVTFTGFKGQTGTVQSLASGTGSDWIGFTQAGTGAVAISAQDKMRQVVSVKDFGAVGDGVTDDTAAIQSAINTIGASKAIYFPAGTYKITSTINLLVAGISLVGDGDNFSYGSSSQNTVLSFTNAGVGINTYVAPNTASSGANVPYISIDNISLNGNNTATVGVDGGFILNMRNCAVTQFITAGVRLGVGGQTSKFTNCGFNANLDGVLSLGGGTYYFDECTFNINTNYGLNGTFNRCVISRSIIESNTLSGVTLSGICTQLAFNDCYFEQNDTALGVNGYQVKSSANFSYGAILFNNTVFGSTTSTKVGNISSGNVIFTNCQQTGVQSDPQFLVGSATVECVNSFGAYVMPTSVKTYPDVLVNPTAALLFSGVADAITITNPLISFGSAGFSVSILFEVDESANASRTLISGALNSLQVLVSGSVNGITQFVFGKAGAAPFATASAPIRPYTPVHLVYVRSANVGYVFVNGSLVTSFADANNYAANQTYIGTDLSGTSGFHGSLLGLSFWTSALTTAEVVNLWKSGGAPYAAKITSNLDFNFQYRKQTVLVENITATNYVIPAGRWATLNNY